MAGVFAFAEAGLTLEFNWQTLQGVTLPVTNIYGSSGQDEKRPDTRKGNLTPDGLVNGLPVVFVSAQDVRAWHGETGWASTVEVFNAKEAAQTLAENNPGLVVFYDPMTYWDIGGYGEEFGETWEKSEEAAREASRQLLREQAEAFLQWLRTEGAR